MEDNELYEVGEVICLRCLQRWIDVHPVSTPLKDLKCKCGAVGFIIKTGQTVEDEEP